MRRCPAILRHHSRGNVFRNSSLNTTANEGGNAEQFLIFDLLIFESLLIVDSRSVIEGRNELLAALNRKSPINNQQLITNQRSSNQRLTAFRIWEPV
jgi:hypothetical protein